MATLLIFVFRFAANVIQEKWQVIRALGTARILNRRHNVTLYVHCRICLRISRTRRFKTGSSERRNKRSYASLVACSFTWFDAMCLSTAAKFWTTTFKITIHTKRMAWKKPFGAQHRQFLLKKKNLHTQFLTCSKCQSRRVAEYHFRYKIHYILQT
jgi:hypothetical protein